MKPTREIADKLMSQGLVSKKDVGELSIFKYTRKVFYNNLWTPELELFRGTVFKGDELVVEPMRKVYNYGENNTGLDLPLDTPVILDYKVNGFCLNVTIVDGEFLFSTTGSLDSEFVDLGRDMFMIYTTEIQKDAILQFEGRTFTFEVCAASDPHIVQEEIGIHLLNISGKSIIMRNLFATRFGFKAHKTLNTTLGQALELARVTQHEGWMVYSPKLELLFKLKTSYYLTKKFMMRSKKASDAMFSDNAKVFFKDEEFFKCLTWIKSQVSKEYWDSLTEQNRRYIIEEYFQTVGAF